MKGSLVAVMLLVTSGCVQERPRSEERTPGVEVVQGETKAREQADQKFKVDLSLAITAGNRTFIPLGWGFFPSDEGFPISGHTKLIKQILEEFAKANMNLEITSWSVAVYSQRNLSYYHVDGIWIDHHLK